MKKSMAYIIFFSLVEKLTTQNIELSTHNLVVIVLEGHFASFNNVSVHNSIKTYDVVMLA